MDTKRFFTLAAILAGSMIVQSTNAQGLVTSFIAEPQALSQSSYVGLSGSFSGQNLPESTLSGQLDLKSGDRQTAKFPSILLGIQPIEVQADLSVGFGESVPIEGIIQFDPIFFMDDSEYVLTAGQNNQFHISQSDWRRVEPSTDQNRLSGSYNFEGPTESISGTFSHSPNWFRLGHRQTLDTTHFPDSVTFLQNDTSWLFEFDNDFELMSGTVDGVNLSVEVTDGHFFTPNNFEFIQIIPEPSTYAFAIGIGLVAFAMFRRMQFGRSGKGLCSHSSNG